ncbi:MAG: hypothetical protein ACOY46_01255 [Bacillota bacterium]
MIIIFSHGGGCYTDDVANISGGNGYQNYKLRRGNVDHHGQLFFGTK